MKTAPIMAEMSRYPNEFDQILIHTGQHYDANMSEVFFDHLGLRKPEHMLEVGSGPMRNRPRKSCSPSSPSYSSISHLG